MRNLVLLNKGNIVPEARTYPDLSVVDAVFDPVSDTVTIALNSSESDIIEVQQYMKSGEVVVLASFAGPADARVLSFNHFSDLATLVFVFENGDIITANYDPSFPDCDTTAVEIVGLIDSGLLASQWSPDEETLAILTKENNLIILSRLFEPISEKRLNPEDIQVTDAKHVSVGWGKEETQFKGKGFKALEREREAVKYAGLDLKEDSPLRDPTVAELQQGTASSFDNNLVKISWRGDCEFFAVTTKEEVASQTSYFRRVIRVFSREGELDSVSEAVDGLEHNLSWRPSGSLIASTQRCKDEDGLDVLNVAFYERNGLRHGEFNTRLNPFEESVLDLEWSSNSEALVFRLKDRFQVWTTKNYHWYLKQEFFVNSEVEDNEVAFVKFHPEKPLQLMVGTTKCGVLMYNFAIKISSGPTVTGSDIGMTVVIDGTEAKITPLAVANVPPPIAYRDYDLEDNIVDSAVNSANDVFAFVSSKNDIHLLSISLVDMKEAKEPTLTKINKQCFAEEGELVKQVCFIQDSVLAVLVDTSASSRVVLFDVTDTEVPLLSSDLDLRAVLLKSRSDFGVATVEHIDGSVWEISDTGLVTYLSRFPTLCTEYEVAQIASEFELTTLTIGITNNGKLYNGEHQLATAVTSMKLTDTLLAFTNAHSQLCFLHLSASANPETFSQQVKETVSTDERIRQIERGSVLISCMPTKYSVVLQAPRGNLETICPRIMVLTGVRKFVKQLKYLDAFLACRTHRIDLDLLHDYDPQLFHDNAELFVQQIGRVDYLDLFVSCLHDEDVAKTKYADTSNDMRAAEHQMADLTINGQSSKHDLKKMIINKEKVKTSTKINKICDAILTVLGKPEFATKFLQTRITAYACQAPPKMFDAMALIGSLADADEQEQAISHLCFLLDVNKLYNLALELYDVKLALNIAQKSQKDPKEYLPFLQNLHVQTPTRRQFLIDDFLGYYEKALGWLFEMGAETSDEYDDYVVKHKLYSSALAAYKYDDERQRQIFALFAEHLHDQRQYAEAAITYEYLGALDDALEDYILSKRWQEALSIAQRLDTADVTDTAQRLSAMLSEDHKYVFAAEIEKRFLNNVEEAIRLFCKGYQFDSGILLAIESNKEDLIESVVDAQLGEGFGVVAELLADCTSQMNLQLNRLRELRAKKEQDPFSFYGAPNDELDTPDNVSVAASETSTTPSFFTKYTGKTSGTAKTGASRKTTKNRKREERKRAKGRKGTIYEEEYLIRSVGRLIERLDQTQTDAVNLLEGLIRRRMILQAYQIQLSWVSLIAFIKENIVEIHNMSERDRERLNDDGEVYLIDEIPVPAVNDFPKSVLLDY